jgi:ABC-type multidrug transport system fused ATPase/permease subunit
MTASRKIWEILTPKQRRGALRLMVLILIGMVLEMAGLGLVIPALGLMVQSDPAAQYPGLAPWLARLGNPTRQQLIVGGMLALVLTSLVKGVFLAFLAWRQSRFVYGLQAELSRRLFAAYLRQPYSFHLQRNSALLIRNTIHHSGGVTTVLTQALTLATEVTVLAGIAVLVVLVEPVGALWVVVVLGLAGWVFNRITRSYIARWGAASQYHEGQRLQHLQQGLGGVKDVKLLGREQDFLDQYHAHNVGSARVTERQSTVAALPRLVFELLGVIGLTTLVGVMVVQRRSPEAVLPVLGLFAAAAFRIMPSVTRILAAVQSTRFAMPMVDTLHGELATINRTETLSSQAVRFDSTLSLEDVTFTYEQAAAPALHGITLSIPRGASVGFIGGSGGGKTTLIDLILGLLTPTSGRICVDGVNINDRLRGWQDQIGYVPQAVFLTDDTLRRNIAFGLANDQIDDAAVWRALRAAQLASFVEGLPEGLATIVGERGVRISGGQRQRIGIARALYHDPSVLVLDEATSSLDTDTERGVMAAVTALQGEKTVLIVAHRLSTVERCDRLFRIEQGRIVAEGSSESVLAPQNATRSGLELTL